MKVQLYITLFLLLPGSLLAQSSISGIVKDANGEVLCGANVYIEGTYDGTTSNAQGYFLLESSASGEGFICIDFIGFKMIRMPVELTGSPLDLSDLVMKEEVNALTAVSITAGTFEAGDKRKSISLSSIDMVTTDGSSGDVYGALQALPGTTTVGESGKLFVKGGDSRESKTFIDGTLVYVPYSSSAPNTSVRGRFSPFMFSGMMFSTGAYSAEFGQALSSVLSLQTNAMEAEDQLNISLLSVGAELGGTKSWEKASLSASFAYTNLYPYMKLVPQYTQWEKEPQALSGDVSFRKRTGKSGMFKFYATLNRSLLTTIEESLNNPGSTFKYDLVNDNQFISSSWSGELKKDWILTTAFSYTNNQDRISIDSLRINETLRGTHAKISLKHRINDRVKLLAGTEWFGRIYGFENKMDEVQNKRTYTNQTLTGFLEAEIYASSRFVTRLGTRYEYSNYLNRSNLAPRISTAYKIGFKSQVSLAYGMFFQDPDNVFLLHTNKLNFERANHYTLNYMINSKLRMLRAELYFKQYKNLVKYGVGDNQTYKFLNNSGEGYAYGLDLFWRDKKSIKNGEYWISYSFIESKRDYLDYPYKAAHAYTSRHNLTLIYKHWISRLRSQFAANYSISSPRYYNNPNNEDFNGEKSMAFQSLNVNWSFLLKQNVIFYFSVSNLLGQEQSFGYKYASRPDNNGIYQGAPVLPSAKRWILLGCFITLSRNGEINQLDKIN
ncbi:MAG: TonB-dependent receptor [Bacteroides sp.]|nr:TonB-dependent receptor [Bacteroides sp.]